MIVFGIFAFQTIGYPRFAPTRERRRREAGIEQHEFAGRKVLRKKPVLGNSNYFAFGQRPMPGQNCAELKPTPVFAGRLCRRSIAWVKCGSIDNEAIRLVRGCAYHGHLPIGPDIRIADCLGKALGQNPLRFFLLFSLAGAQQHDRVADDQPQEGCGSDHCGQCQPAKPFADSRLWSGFQGRTCPLPRTSHL